MRLWATETAKASILHHAMLSQILKVAFSYFGVSPHPSSSIVSNVPIYVFLPAFLIWADATRPLFVFFFPDALYAVLVGRARPSASLVCRGVLFPEGWPIGNRQVL